MLFAERGFDATSVRSIAAAAGVDPALVLHYFGSKQRLFVETMELPFDPPSLVAGLLASGEVGIGERLARSAFEIWDMPPVREIMLGVIRSASSDEQAAAMLREMFVQRGFLPLARALGRPNPEFRALLVGAHLIGVAMARLILKAEPLASADSETIVAAIGPTLDRYLLGEIGLAGEDETRHHRDGVRAGPSA
jgi:AcrR family transcriptional regulator